MANTVNDVMNVIASPDYGIKNIAGTNQEILAILQGTHNNKNNLHALVDDVKNLLQKLVDVSTQKKPIEIGDKKPKINPKNIKDILDETKNIRKSIDNLTKAVIKQSATGSSPAIAKLTDKASQKVADAMIKDMEKQNKGGGMSALVDAFGKLKDFSLKDIILGSQKLKQITKIFDKSKKDLKIDEKTLESIIKVINASPDIVASLSKVSKKINKIIKNDVVGKLSEILIGKNSLLSLSKKIEKSEKIFNNAIKTTNTIKEFVLLLSKTMKELFITSLWTKVISNKSIEFIETTTNKLISLSNIITKNKKDIENGAKAAKSIKDLVSLLNKTMRKLVFASLWAKVANIGITSIENTINNLLPLSTKLSKNKKDIENGAKAAKNITVLVGNLLISSIFLTVAAIVGIPAILGAKVLAKLIDLVIPAAKELSKNKKHLAGAAVSSILFVAFTGIMGVASLALSAIAVMGIPALLGSFVVLGVVAINIITFEMLNKAKKNILIGSIMMALMSISLILYGTALGKITKATENVTWKQVGIIAGTLVILALATAVMGEPTTASFISLGSLTMSLMSFGLLIFGTALGQISKSTENVTMKQILTVGGSMLGLGLPIAGLGVLSVPIGLGSVVLGVMSVSLYTFTKALKLMSDMGDVPTKTLNQVLNSMKTVRNFFIKNGLKLKAVWNANKYKMIMRPLIKGAKILSKLKDLGSVPMKLVYQTLNAMKAVGDYYQNNPISRKAIKQARRYRDMMRPFGKTLRHFAKLKKLGSIPMKLIYQTLNAMSAIANYYANNPISKKAIRQSYKYRDMMRPFGKTLNYFVKLKELGSVPMKLVYQTLNAMSAIANYYSNNPISKHAIKQARRYKRMMRPFGKTLKFFGKLKEMGSVPMKLVYQALNAMRTIGNYYGENPISRKAIRQADRYKSMMKPFGKTLEFLGKLKDIGTIPIDSIRQALDASAIIANFYMYQNVGHKGAVQAIINGLGITNAVIGFVNTAKYLKEIKDLPLMPLLAIKSAIIAINNISWFYNTLIVPKLINYKTKSTEMAVDKFTTMAKNIQDKFEGIKEVNNAAVRSIIWASSSIVDFYAFKLLYAPEEKIDLMNLSVEKYIDLGKKVSDKFSQMKIVDHKLFNSILWTCRDIVNYYAFKYSMASEEKVNLMNYAVDKYITLGKKVSDKFNQMNIIDHNLFNSILWTFKDIVNFYANKSDVPPIEKVNIMNYSIKSFSKLTKTVKDDLQEFSPTDYVKVIFALKSMKKIVKFLQKNTLNRRQRNRARKNMIILKNMAYAMSNLSNVNPSNIASVGDALANSLKGVSTIDLSQVQAVTNMFNAFNGINKSESIINKFTESVKEFTTTCKNLMDAMNTNTYAINNMDISIPNESNEPNSLSIFDKIKNNIANFRTNNNNSNSTNENNGVCITNVDELARSIAEKINGALSVDVPDTQVQLLINGTGGNEWTISRY